MLFYSEGCGKIARLLSFVEGKCLNEFKYTSKLLYSFGSTLALLDTYLLDFKNIAIELRKSVWDLQHYHLNKKTPACTPTVSFCLEILFPTPKMPRCQDANGSKGLHLGSREPDSNAWCQRRSHWNVGSSWTTGAGWGDHGWMDVSFFLGFSGWFFMMCLFLLVEGRGERNFSSKGWHTHPIPLPWSGTTSPFWDKFGKKNACLTVIFNHWTAFVLPYSLHRYTLITYSFLFLGRCHEPSMFGVFIRPQLPTIVFLFHPFMGQSVAGNEQFPVL